MLSNGQPSFGLDLDHRFSRYLIWWKTACQSRIWLFEGNEFLQRAFSLIPALGSHLVCRASRPNHSSLRRTQAWHLRRVPRSSQRCQGNLTFPLPKDLSCSGGAFWFNGSVIYLFVSITTSDHDFWSFSWLIIIRILTFDISGLRR